MWNRKCGGEIVAVVKPCENLRCINPGLEKDPKQSPIKAVLCDLRLVTDQVTHSINPSVIAFYPIKPVNRVWSNRFIDM